MACCILVYPAADMVRPAPSSPPPPPPAYPPAPGASIGSAHQFVSLLSGRLISEVDMEVWPGLRGTVVTTSAINPLPPASLELQVCVGGIRLM
jgi:hypothetical protein